MPHVSGVVLAGGQSRRMGGAPKGLIPFGERPLIQHIAETLTALLPDCVVVTNSPELYGFLGLPMVPDLVPGGGSLGGIYSGLTAAPGEAAFCVACDMPFLSRRLISHLVSRAGEGDVIVPDVGGQLQTLHAVYGKACLPAMARRLAAGRLKIAGFFGDVTVVRVPESMAAGFDDLTIALMNLNTPDELARAQALWAERPAATGASGA